MKREKEAEREGGSVVRQVDAVTNETATLSAPTVLLSPPDCNLLFDTVRARVPTPQAPAVQPATGVQRRCTVC